MNPAWGTARIVHGNALDLPLEDASVDLVVTSPPYFSLRSYQDNGEHYAGQIGAEATPAEFVAALLEATREMVRVLKPSGSIWVNLGDKYAGHTNGTGGHRALKRTFGTAGTNAVGAPTKSLIGVPWRYALACIDDLGLILRAEVIWSKPNGLPESVTDRVRRSHEVWFHFVTQPRYYSAVDEIRETTQGRPGLTWAERRTRDDSQARYSEQNGHGGSGGMADNPLGKLPGSVWTIPTQPLTVPASLGIDHFAAFPMEWPRRIIRGWSPAGVCVACGQGRRPVVAHGAAFDLSLVEHRKGNYDQARKDGGASARASGQEFNAWRAANPHTLTGYACACPDTTAPTTPGVVLDPFSGTGTTALVAKVLGREGIGVELSQDYVRLANWRTTDPGQIASAMEVAKPAAQVDGQGDLFTLDFGEVTA